MRREFGRVIAEIIKKDPLVHLLVGDTGYKIFPELLGDFPLSSDPLRNRLHNFGVSEQSMVGIGAAMAIEDVTKPWVYALTPFLLERAFEQVKIGVNLQKVNVKLVGYADYPGEGPTHELITERLADVFPNIRSFYPTDSVETREAVWTAYRHQGPTFISLKKDRKK